MTAVAGVLLAGGLARRMGGGDKCLRPLAGETLLARVIARVAPQVGPLILNANSDPRAVRALRPAGSGRCGGRLRRGRSPAS